MFKRRLNMYSKQRWSMLRTMTASLFMHEKVTTTKARAKTLVPVVNKIYKMALKNDKHSMIKIAGLLRANDSYYKLFNNLLNRYK